LTVSLSGPTVLWSDVALPFYSFDKVTGQNDNRDADDHGFDDPPVSPIGNQKFMDGGVELAFQGEGRAQDQELDPTIHDCLLESSLGFDLGDDMAERRQAGGGI
jgi:hypothetical protein